MPAIETYCRITNGYLELRVPVTKGTPSASGKNLVIATSNGFAAVDGGNARISYNVITTKPAK